LATVSGPPVGEPAKEAIKLSGADHDYNITPLSVDEKLDAAHSRIEELSGT